MRRTLLELPELLALMLEVALEEEDDLDMEADELASSSSSSPSRAVAVGAASFKRVHSSRSIISSQTMPSSDEGEKRYLRANASSSSRGSSASGKSAPRRRRLAIAIFFEEEGDEAPRAVCLRGVGDRCGC